MIVVIHQPEHLPWLGFFDKAARADVLILLDDVPYRKNYFQNRNRIRTSSGEAWLTVPVQSKGKLGQLIRDVRIDREGNPRWRAKSLATLSQEYRRAPFWRDHEPFFADLYGRDWQSLAELNEHGIGYVATALGIRARTVRSSELNAGGDRTSKLLALCRAVGATTYLSGVSGREYLDLGAFAAAGIGVSFQEFRHPIYRQLHEPFLPCMSAVDLLLNHGHDSAGVLRGVGVERLAHVFE